MVERLSHTAKTLSAVAGIYLSVGLLIVIAGDSVSDRPRLLLVLLGVALVLSGAVMIRAIRRLAAGIQSADETLRDVGERLEKVRKTLDSLQAARSARKDVRVLDLARIGPGDPSALVAATLDRSAFPRLVETMENHPPAASADPRPEHAPAPDSLNDLSPPDAGDVEEDDGDGVSVTTRNLSRQWMIGLRNGDLPLCRAVFSALVDTVDGSKLALLGEQMNRLADQTEKSLRASFSERFDKRDYAGMLAIGEQLCRMLPDRSVTEEFRRIKPHIILKEQQTKNTDKPPLRFVR